MSRINGEKARAAVERKRRTNRRAETRAAQTAGSDVKKPGGRPMAARHAKRSAK